MTTQWNPPGAGQWRRDDTHITSVWTGYMDAIATPTQLEGFAAGFEYFGATLAGFDAQVVAGRPYLRPRIAGAPALPIWGASVPARLPSPPKAPPPFILKVLFRLHPELRRRARRAAQVWEEQRWREMMRAWQELRPALVEQNRAATRLELSTMDDAALVRHLEQATARFRAMFTQHFKHTAMTTIVVGDFLVRSMRWTGASAREVLATLQGASPASREGADAVTSIASAVAADPAARALVESDRPAAEIVAALRATGGEVGARTDAYLVDHGLRPVTGLDVYHELVIDLPELLVRAIRTTLTSGADAYAASTAEKAAATAAAALRERVGAEHRVDFDAALAETRAVYAVRDDDVGITVWSAGILYRALREAGARLAGRGLVRTASNAWEATPEELPALLRGAPVATSDELARRAARRAELDALEPPFVLGEAGAMPALSSFPPAVRRMQEAVTAFLAALDGEHAGPSTGITGTGVSQGVYEGRARIVRDHHDFARLERGDVLVARYTSPAYNVVLPLLGAIVTERGGLLSHAAIVAREYGIPAVVDTRDALARIADGAIVRVDGASGTVEVVRPPDSRSSVASPATPRDRAPDLATLPRHDPRTSGRVVPLRDASSLEFGGKATALSAAVAAKLPVPDGVALDADLVARVVAGELEACDRVLAAVATLPAPWAVRSSAVGEDSESASFAGQHATMLGVQPGAVFEAIRSVHASAYTEAAAAYRARMGVSGTARMGVVIQTLLRPDISGVLFSRDPSAQREGRVVEATWGLGEALVAGLVTPDRYRIATDGRVLERAIGDKDIAIEARDQGGTAEVAIADERARRACLDDDRLVELAELASRCEQLFGGPQDLEWAVAGGRLHLLQSRPVTTSAQP